MQVEISFTVLQLFPLSPAAMVIPARQSMLFLGGGGF
jgi:hypothetical protein